MSWIRIVLGGLCVCLHSLHFCFNFCRNKLSRLRAILKFRTVGSVLLAFSLLDTIPMMPCAASPRLLLLVSLGQATASTIDYRYMIFWYMNFCCIRIRLSSLKPVKPNLLWNTVLQNVSVQSFTRSGKFWVACASESAKRAMCLGEPYKSSNCIKLPATKANEVFVTCGEGNLCRRSFPKTQPMRLMTCAAWRGHAPQILEFLATWRDRTLWVTVWVEIWRMT